MHAPMTDLVVRGPRLTLRYARPADAAALFALGRDPEVTRFFSWGPYSAEAEAEAYIARLPAERADGRHLDFVIAGPGDVPIGVTGLGEWSLRDRRAVVGTWLGREHWGTGANHEAKALVTALAFGAIGLGRLGAYAAPGNPRSQRALEKIGFAREGTLRAFHRHGDTVYDVHVFGLLRAEWEAGPLAGVPAQVAGEPPPAFAISSAAR